MDMLQEDIHRYITHLTLTNARYIVYVYSLVHSCYMFWCYCHTIFREVTPKIL
jgi:hypothetical protein